jgi:hypothetical protein
VSWMRLPQVSSKMATVVGPTCVGSIVNTTPTCFIRSASFRMSSTKKDASGIPCAKSAALNVLVAGFSSGSRSSCTPSGSSGETTVSHLKFPTGKSCFFWNPSAFAILAHSLELGPTVRWVA